MLNTGIENTEYIKYVNFGAYEHISNTVDDVVKDIINNKIPLSTYYFYFGQFSYYGIYKMIIQSHSQKEYASAIVFSYAYKGILFYTKTGGVYYKRETNWTETQI